MSIKLKFNIKKENFTLDVDLSLPDKGITALFGPSGCGKTTLLRAIAGLDFHQGGALSIGDTIWQSDDVFIPTHQRSLSYVFQQASLFPHLTVLDNIEYGIKRKKNTSDVVSISDVIELLNIQSLLNRNTNDLSGGEAQRVAIARALAVSPSLLLMDEPLAALDDARKQEIMPYLEELHTNFDIPIIYVSHSKEEVSRLADYLVLMEQGSVEASGDIFELSTQTDLAFNHESDAAVIITAKFVESNIKYNLMVLDFDGVKISVINNENKKSLSIGDSVRLRLAARDISITLEHQPDTSILNIIPVVVDDIIEENKAQVLVRLRTNNNIILSRITRKSVDDIDLQKGKAVYAQVKSVALVG